MTRTIVVALSVSLTAAHSGVAVAQFLPPPVVLPMPQGVPPQNCMPGQFCPSVARFGFRCQTPQFWCSLPQPGAIGTACYCNSPYGVLGGWVVQ
jgi:hypothetical protein